MIFVKAPDVSEKTKPTVTDQDQDKDQEETLPDAEDEPETANGRKEDYFTFLLVGEDTSSGSTDTIMLASYDAVSYTHLDVYKRQARQELRSAKRTLEDAQDAADAAKNVIQGHTLRMDSRRKREETAAKAHMELTMEQSNLDSRIRLLSEMEKEYEGFSKAVKVVMQAGERRSLRGIHGPVASLIQVDRCV